MARLPSGAKFDDETFRDSASDQEPVKLDGGQDQHFLVEKEKDQETPARAGEDLENDRPRSRDWRAEDRALFRSLLGDYVELRDCSPWQPGVYPVDAFYDALRRDDWRRAERLKWPGLWLETLDGDYGSGLANWLDEHCIEPFVEVGRGT